MNRTLLNSNLDDQNSVPHEAKTNTFSLIKPSEVENMTARDRSLFGYRVVTHILLG